MKASRHNMSCAQGMLAVLLLLALAAGQDIPSEQGEGTHTGDACLFEEHIHSQSLGDTSPHLPC
jgi:hypothetical protein